MINNLYKKITLCLLCVLLVFSSVGCKNDDKSKNSVASDYQVWSAPSTVKIKQDELDYKAKGDAEIKISAVKNEYESCQLIISTKDSISEYYLSAADLTNGSTIFNKENFEIFKTHFVNVDALSDSAIYGVGYYPDALIPIDAARTAKELSTAANTNVEIWITAYIPKETVAGTYSGNFELSVDGVKKNIPVELKVYDYTLTDEMNTGSMFTNRYNRIGLGEKDNSVEMMREYYGFFAEYRTSLEILPVEVLTVEELVACAQEYYDNCSYYSITHNLGERSQNIMTQRAFYKEAFLGFAAASNEEKNLIKKLLIYGIDEPDLSKLSIIENVITQLTEFNAMLDEIIAEIEADTTDKYEVFKSMADWNKQIKDIDMIIPQNMNYVVAHKDEEKMQEYLNLVDCVCPLFTVFNDATRDQYFDLIEKYDLRQWWYGCVNPQAPFSTYHIGDANLLSARTISWLQKAYNVEGNLYWGASSYATEESGYNYESPIDLYNIPYCMGVGASVAGDGSLTYPGAKYNIYGPVPSMRLMAIRDGMEDYEILNDLEDEYSELLQAYGSEIDAGTLLNRFYSAVSYEGIKLFSDGTGGLDFTQLREELIDSLFEAKDSIENSGFILTNIKVSNNIATVEYNLRDGYQVKIDNEAQTPIANQKYSYELDLRTKESITFEITKGNYKRVYTKKIGSSVVYLATFDDWTQSDCQTNIFVSDGSECEITQDAMFATSGQSVKATLKSVFTGNSIDDLKFRPTMSLKVSALENVEDFSSLSIISIDVYNGSDEYITSTIRFESGKIYYDHDDVTLKPGKNTIKIDISSIKWSKLKETELISFRFKNAGTEEEPKIYYMSLDNIYVQ